MTLNVSGKKEYCKNRTSDARDASEVLFDFMN